MVFIIIDDVISRNKLQNGKIKTLCVLFVVVKVVAVVVVVGFDVKLRAFKNITIQI